MSPSTKKKSKPSSASRTKAKPKRSVISISIPSLADVEGLSDYEVSAAVSKALADLAKQKNAVVILPAKASKANQQHHSLGFRPQVWHLDQDIVP